ncbi:MAG: GDSL-type esterase/lipase family protein [Cyanobacteriota bacterium]
MQKVNKVEINKVAFLISISLNLLILGLGTFWVASKGGIPYIIRTVSYLLNPESIDNNSFYVVDKKSLFETLPKSGTDIVFVGDSLTDFGEWQEFFRNVSIKNRGLAGDTTDGILSRIDNIVESKPKKIFIMIGINEFLQNESVDEIANSYNLVLEKIKEKSPQTQVFIQSVLPLNKNFADPGINNKVIELNAKLKDLSQKNSYQYIDLFPSFLGSNNQLDEQYTTDGLHLNGKGYLLWKTMIEKEVVK